MLKKELGQHRFYPTCSPGTRRSVVVGRCGDVEGRGVWGAIGSTEARVGWGGGWLEGRGHGGRRHERGGCGGGGGRCAGCCEMWVVDAWWGGGMWAWGGVRGDTGAYHSYESLPLVIRTILAQDMLIVYF